MVPYSPQRLSVRFTTELLNLWQVRSRYRSSRKYSSSGVLDLYDGHRYAIELAIVLCGDHPVRFINRIGAVSVADEVLKLEDIGSTDLQRIILLTAEGADGYIVVEH